MGLEDRLRERALAAIDQRVFPGCVIGAIGRDGTRTIVPFGTLAYEDEPVRPETVYDMASVTKSMPLSSLALIFLSEGGLRLSDKVTAYIPELKNDHGATIEDLLRYRVKGPQMSALHYRTFEEIRTHIFEHGFDGPPGESAYTNLPAYLLGIVIERVAGASLPPLGHKYFFGPLGMKDTTFFPATSDCAPTEIDDSGNLIRGLVHDESARIFAQARRAVGHAGLFSTAGDMLNFLEALLNDRFPAVVEGAQEGLGWAVAQEWFMGTCVSNKAFGKTGFTGTSIITDREKGTALVILSNRTYPKRPPDATSLTSAINLFRRDIADIVFSYAA